MCDAPAMRASRRVAPVYLALVSVCGAFVPAVSARPPVEISGPQPVPTTIFGGTLVDRCAWPSVVAVSGGDTLCTGTLVHPRLVLFAAHCGEGIKKIYFGEDLADPGLVVKAEYCLVNPDYGGPSDQEHDWGFCRLAEAITDVPVTPVVFGCETALVESQGMAAIAGYGLTTDDSDSGRKHWATAKIRQVYSETSDVGGLGDPAICPGDSGGPAFIRYADGSWHTFGIASTLTGASCGGIGNYALAWNAAPWVEESSGIDITPCHDIDGTWNPSFRCTDFYAGEPGAGAGAWPTCTDTPRIAASETCGAAFDSDPDDTPPTVEITTPTSGVYADGDGLSTAIEISADDGDGWGVAYVRLKINGEVQPVVDDQAPYGFAKVDFPAGTWELIAVAEDAAGLVRESPPVTLEVRKASSETGDTPTTTAGTTASATDSEDTASMDAGEDGCGCASDRSWTGALALLVVPVWRRRRARA